MRPFDAEPISIEKGYVRLAIVKEEEQREKMREAFSNQGDTKEDQKLFENKRLTCFEQIYGVKEPVEVTEVFDPDKDKTPKRLLVLGRAGIGKSTLCQYMSYQWANSANLEANIKLWKKDGKEKFKLVVWVALRNLLSSNSKTIYDVILNEVISTHEFDPSKKSFSLEEVTRALNLIKPSEILYILDDYDEVAGRTNVSPQ